MKPYYETKLGKLYHGKCEDVGEHLEPVDAIVTDPPYGLSFMNKKWDYNVPSVGIWQACLRILKPGGMLLSFAGTRTQHRMACNIEDAGFEIRDMITELVDTNPYFAEFVESLSKEQLKTFSKFASCDGLLGWGYGSGFPKSHNIGIAVDKLQGNNREIIGKKLGGTPKTGLYEAGFGVNEGKYIAGTKGTSEYEGWGTALKPAFEPITVARKPLSEKTVAANVLKHGTGGISISECRITSGKMDNLLDYAKNIYVYVSNAIGGNKFCKVQKHNESSLHHNFDKLYSFLAGDSYRLADGVELNAQNQIYQKFVNFLSGCPACFCLCDALVHFLSAGDQLSVRQLNDVHKYIHLFENMGGMVVSPLHTHEKYNDHLSNLDYFPLSGAPSEIQNHYEKEYYSYVKCLESFHENNHICLPNKWNRTHSLIDILSKSFFLSLGQTCNLDEFSYSLLKFSIILNITNTVHLVKKKILESSRFPANFIHDGSDEVLELFPDTKSGDIKPHKNKTRQGNVFGKLPLLRTAIRSGDQGSAARFFYCAKSSRRERGKGNNHPTVKPLELMKYLITLVTPKGGIVLDPFVGSGTTAIACEMLGIKWIAIEKDEDSCEIAAKRIEQETSQLKLF